MSFGGFGISTPEMAKLLLDHGFAGVVVGTAMIKKLNSSSDELYEFVRKLKKAAGKAGESR
jgi:tryptophan synthase alpha chain